MRPIQAAGPIRQARPRAALAERVPARDDADVADEIETEMTEAPDPSPEPDHGVATGHAEIDAALRRLDDLSGLPVEQHAGVYEEIHGQLRDALSAAATPPAESAGD
jgi:hypothetical protein